MARVEISPDCLTVIMPMWQKYAAERLGPEVADDARKYCPVRSGALKASIEDHMDGDDLIVSATGGGEDDSGNLYVSRRPGKVSAAGGSHPGADQARHVGTATTRAVHHVEEGGRAYALWVETGHRVYHPSTGVTGPEVVPAQPFLRPALFTRRGE
ncbi:MAG: hypothetical protein ACRDP7_30270 [Trebonia sp.]